MLDAIPHKSSSSSLQGEVVWGIEQCGTGPLIDPDADRRPKVEDPVILRSGTPTVKILDIGAWVDGWQTGIIRSGCDRGAAGGAIGRLKRGTARMNECLRGGAGASFLL